MINKYIARFQWIILFLAMASAPALAQTSDQPNGGVKVEPASKPTFGTLSSIPPVTGEGKKVPEEVMVIEGEAPVQPPVTPDLRKHPEIGQVKLEGSPNSVEIMEYREADSRTFQNPDGSFTKQQTKGKFHYKDEQGYWRTIGQTPTQIEGGNVGINATDLPIIINPSTGLTTMQLDTKGEGISFGTGATVTYLNKSGAVVQTTTAGSNLSHQLDGSTLTVKEMWPGIDRKQNITYYQVETDYIIQNRPNVQLPDGKVVFTENIILPKGWKIEKGNGRDTTDGFLGSLRIVDAKGQEKGQLARLVFYDSNKDHKTHGNVIGGAYTFSQSGNQVTLGVVVPANWLLAANRQYPVTIDPTVSNTYATFGFLEYQGFYTSCQEQLNVNVPAGNITATATTYQITARYGGWRNEQRSRLGRGGNWTATQSGVGASAGTYYYSLSNQTIANGAHAGGNVLFTWQGYRTWANWFESYCDYYSQYLVGNSWVVTVTYDNPTPCSGNPNPGTLAISATTGCSGTTNYTLTSTGYTTTGSGLQYNFQTSPAGANTWTDLTGWQNLGGSNPTFTTNTTIARDYRIQYRCNAGTPQNSNVVTHTPVTCIFLNVNQQVQTTCAAKIYDSGGPTGNYSNNEARVVIIYPTSPDQVLTVSGSYNTEFGYDYLSMVSGASSDITTYEDPYLVSGAGTISYTAPGPGIPITVKFSSDPGVVGPGFDLDVTCACGTPTAATAAAADIITCGGTSDIFFSGVAGQDLYTFGSSTFVGNALPTGAFIGNNAAVTGEYVRLTSTAASQQGSLVFTNVNNLNGNSFLSYFKMYAGGGSGADGMSFSFWPQYRQYARWLRSWPWQWGAHLFRLLSKRCRGSA